MNPNKNSDDLLRDKLNNYSSPIPAGMFDAIDNQRKKEKPKAAAFGWPLKFGVLSLAFVFAFGICYWQLSSLKSNKSNIAESNIAVSTKGSEKTKLESNISKEIKTVINSASEANFTINEQNTANKFSEGNLFNSTEKTNSVETSTVVWQSKQRVNSTEIKANVSQTKEIIDTNVNAFEANPSSNTIQGSTLNSKRNMNDEAKTNEVFAEESAPKLKIKKENVREYSTILALNKKNIPSLLDRHDAIMPPIKCPSLIGKKMYMYYDAIASLDLAFRSLNPKASNDELASYATLRNSTEGIQESFSLGFRASSVFRFKKKVNSSKDPHKGQDSRISNTGIAFRTGLIYSQINEPFSKNEYVEQTRDIITYDENDVIIGMETDTIIVVHEFRSANRHKLIDVPFIVGYEFDQEKFNTSINAGVYVNIHAAQKGEFLNRNQEIVNFTSTRPNHYEAFKTNVGLSLYGSFSVNYKITPTLHFIFEPYGRYYFNSFTLGNYELDQKYFTGGVQMGLRMKI